jgi:hypothetical protein
MTTLNNLLTADDIAHFREIGACDEGLAWCEERPRTWGECVEEYANWLLEHACERLTDEQFAVAVTVIGPRAALEYQHACARLTDEQFAAAVAREPGYALGYQHACARLTDEQLAAAAARDPGYALAYQHACDRLTDEQFAAAVAREPRAALEYPHACERLSAGNPLASAERRASTGEPRWGIRTSP